MTDFDFPELPSDEELGITKEDREAYEEEVGPDKPEMSEAELAALLGESPPVGGGKSSSAAGAGAASGAAGGASGAAGKDAGPTPPKSDAKPAKDGKETRAARKAAKKAAREAKRAEKDAARAARAHAKASAQEEKSDASEAKAARSAEKAAAAESNRPVQPALPRKKWLGPVTLAVMVGAAVLGSGRTGLPDPVPANAADTVFSSARAMTELIEIARAPHPPGAPEHARVREHLVNRLEELGLETEIQTVQSMRQNGGFARIGTMRNIVARLPGTDPTGALLLTAHYDSREQSHGAGDDGSGVVSILEAIRASQSIGPLENDVIVLFTDGEELGLLGARAFVDEHPLMADVSLAISFEMRGGGGPSIMFETRDENGWIVKELAAFDPHPFANSMSYEVYQRMPNDTDFTPFREAGVQGLNFAAIDNAHVYHQSYDRPENLSEETIQHHGIRALAALRHLGTIDISEASAPNVVYFSVPFAGLIVYESWGVFALSGLIVVLLGLATLLAVRRGARPGRIGGALAVALVSTGLSAAAALGVLELLPRYHAEYGTLHGSAIHSEGWYLLAIVATAFTVVVSMSLLARRWFHLSELALGALIVPAIVALVVSFAAPLAAMNLQWPVLASALALMAAAALGPRVQAPVGALVTTLAAGLVILIMSPVIELLWLALSIRMAVVLAVLTAVAVQLCLPVLDNLRHPNDWWSPAVGVLVAGLGLTLGVLSARPTVERPAPSTLVYAYEHGSGAAWWTSDPIEDDLDDEAGAWAVASAGSSLGELVSLEAFGIGGRDVPATDALVVDAPRPAVLVTRDDMEGRTRVVDLRVRSRVGAEMIQFRRNASSSTLLTSINGIEIESPADLVNLEHWGEPEGFITLELEMGADDPIDLHIVEHLLRPWELLGDEPFERPAELALNVNRLSDRALLRYSIADFADPRHAIFELDPAPELIGDPEQAPSESLTGDEPPTQPGTVVDSVAVTDSVDVDAVGTDAPMDSLPADSLRPDSLPADTLPRDTLPTGPLVAGPAGTDSPPDTVPVFTRSR